MGAVCFKPQRSPEETFQRNRRRSKTSSLNRGPVNSGSIKQRVQTGFNNWINPDTRTWEEKVAIVEGILSTLFITNDDLLKVMDLLMKEFEMGLGKDTNAAASVKMLPTFVRDVPDGTEVGKFLALDLGGTNFRVLLIKLETATDSEPEFVKFEISKELMLGPGEKLFDYIAKCLYDFTIKTNVKDEKLYLGFTFSFPLIQKGLSQGTLVQWTKGFKCSGVEGNDVVDLLRAAIKRRGDLDIEVLAIMNDTTGTLMSCSHRNNDCRVGVIIGTGTNACYMEQLENVGTWTDPINEPKQVIVNTEWGAFGDNGCLDFIRTQFDIALDGQSLNPGKQTFEKMVSGLFLGELVRRILLKLTEDRILFNGKVTKLLSTQNIINAKFLSKVEDDPYRSYNGTRSSLAALDVHDFTDAEAEIVKWVCSRVSTRAAFLAGAAIATVIKKMKRSKTLVGVDGSVYKFHPNFRFLMRRKIYELVPREHKFELMLSEDGSGVGAAVVAAVAHRQRLIEKGLSPSSPNTSAGSAAKSRKERKKTIIHD